jgi:hypothetical protein
MSRWIVTEEIQRIADQLQQEAETFKTLAASAEASGEVRLPPSTVDGLARRFAQMSESLKKIASDLPTKENMRTKSCFLALVVLAFLSTGCNNGSNTDLSYKTAINDHFKAFPTCIWSEAKKFPVQAATSDDSKTEGYDALTQEGY